MRDKATRSGHTHSFEPDNCNGELHLSSVIPPDLPEPADRFGQVKYYDQQGVPFPVYEARNGPRGFFKNTNNPDTQAFILTTPAADQGTTFESQGTPVEIQEFTRHAGDPVDFWRDVDEQNSKAVLITGAKITRFLRRLSDKPDVWREDGTQKTIALTGNGKYVSR